MKLKTGVSQTLSICLAAGVLLRLIVTAFDACEEEFHRVKEYYCEEPQMV
jgi:hypothetical protein